MTRKIAVLVMDRKSEALRMSAGLTLLDDSVDVFVLDDELKRNDEINLHLEALEMVESPIYSNNRKNDFQFMDLQQIAGKLLEYDIVIPY